MQECSAVQEALTSNNCSHFDDAHGVLKKHIQNAVQPALGGEDSCCHCHHHWQVNQSPQWNRHLNTNSNAA